LQHFLLLAITGKELSYCNDTIASCGQIRLGTKQEKKSKEKIKKIIKHTHTHTIYGI
jgi:hypothetical protein